MKKTIIISVIAGILLTIFAFHAYNFYQIRKATIQNTQAIAQVVSFINSQLQSSQTK